MYEFSPTPEQERILAKTRALMAELVYPNEKYCVPHRGLPYERLKPLQQRVKEAGLWAAHMPGEAGGLGMGFVTLALMTEQLGRSPIASRIFGTQAPDTGNMELLWHAGTAEQKETWLKPLQNDDIRSCIAMTEPEVSGADPTTILTSAVRDGDSYIINGHKWFATGAALASFAIVFARTGGPDTPVHQSGSLFIVPVDTPGFEMVREIPVMGDQSEGGHGELRFHNLRVPASALLGQEGEGFKLTQFRLNKGRITHCMRWLGVAQRSFELMLAYAGQRETRGKKLVDYQTVQNWIADSYAEMQAAKLLTLHAAWKLDCGEEPRAEISLIKFWGAKVLHDVIDRAIQVHGALGFSGDTILEGFYREARAARIYDGPDEVHRMVVSRQVLRSFAKGTLSV